MKYYDLFIEFVHWYEAKYDLIHTDPFGFDYLELEHGNVETRIPTLYDVQMFSFENSNLIVWNDEKVDALYYYFIDAAFPQRSISHRERYGRI
jgi:hypothetical protein